MKSTTSDYSGELYRALMVMLEDRRIRRFLDRVDPMIVAQAVSAISDYERGQKTREEERSKIALIELMVDKRAFVNSHGHNPKGRGQWWFALKTGNALIDTYCSGTNVLYSSALQGAKKKAQEVGAITVQVLP